MAVLKLIPPQRAVELMRQGALLVDIREPQEHAQERIAGAKLHPLSSFSANAPVASGNDAVIYHCRSGTRTLVNADKLGAAAPGEAYVMEGGIEAWKAAGLPVETGAK